MFDPGALLSRTYRLPEGLPVRLRLPQSGDAAGIQALSDGQPGLVDIELARLLHFDPRRRLVICATALVDGVGRVVGVGAIDLDHSDAQPTVLAGEDQHREAIEELLRAALIGRAHALLRARAA